MFLNLELEKDHEERLVAARQVWLNTQSSRTCRAIDCLIGCVYLALECIRIHLNV